jgi:acyl carrier protein
MSSTVSSPVVMLFPAKAVETCLRDAVAAAAADQAAIRTSESTSGSGKEIGWEPEADSLVVLTVLTALEEQFGIELPDDVVPPGGYADTETCIRHLLQHARVAWSKKHVGTVT